MILNCITAIIIVAIVCTAIVVNSYISKKTADYKAALKKREDFMSCIGWYIDRIDDNIINIDNNRTKAKANIKSNIDSIKDKIFKYCDRID